MPYTPMVFQGPQIANVIPALAWMLTNSVCPSGLNVDPANSSPYRGVAGGVCQPVERDVPDPALAGQPAQVVVAAAVLADHERAAASTW